MTAYRTNAKPDEMIERIPLRDRVHMLLRRLRRGLVVMWNDGHPLFVAPLVTLVVSLIVCGMIAVIAALIKIGDAFGAAGVLVAIAGIGICSWAIATARVALSKGEP